MTQPLGLVARASTPAGSRSTRLQPRSPAAGEIDNQAVQSHATAAVSERRAGALTIAQQAALEGLFTELVAGADFTPEEAEILRHFAGGFEITPSYADLLVSRALHDQWLGKQLSPDQQRLVDAYNVAEENHRQNALANKRRIGEEEASAAPRAPQAPPANDLCAGAISIPAGPFPVTSALTADITDATTTGDPGVPSCQSSVSRSVWYTFTPASTGPYNISTCADAPTGTTVDDTVLAVYTSTGGCAGPFTELPTAGASDGCDDDTCTTEANQSVLTTMLTGGTLYYLVVWKFGTAAPTAGNTAVQIRINQANPPANDTCAGAQVLPLNQSTLGSTVNATNDYQLSGSACFTGVGQVATTATGRDVVYSFTAPSAGSYSFRVWNNLSVSDIVIYVASTCPTATPGTPVTVASCLGAANRNSVQSGEEVLCLSLTASQQVFVFVDEAAATAGGSFFVQVENCLRETEPNGTTATANAIACVIEGSISPAGDVDFYSLGSPAAGDRIYVMVDGAAGPSSNVDARLTTATDTLEFDDADADFPYGNLSSVIAGRPAPGGPVFLRVTHNSVTTAHEPYRVYYVVQPASTTPTAESEPNDTTGTADTSPVNYFSGSLPGPAPSTDVDVYSFTATAGDLVFIGLDQDPARDLTPIDAAMELLDSNGTSLVFVDDFTNTSSNTSGAGSLTATTPNSPAEAIVFRAPTSGTFFVAIDIESGATAANGAGDYVLSISRNCMAGGGAPPAGKDTVGIVSAASCFFLRNTNDPGPADIVACYATPGNVPIKGDWNGDGTDTIAVYRPSTSEFFLRNSNTPGPADITFTFGAPNPSFVPISGDWNNDGTDTIGLYDSSNGTFLLRNSNTAGPADITFSFGAGGVGIQPITGDWNNDGTDTVGIYNPATGVVFLTDTNASGPANNAFTYGAPNANYRAVAGDYNNDGTDSIGVYDMSTGGFFLKNTNSNGTADITFFYGPAGQTPLIGDWDNLP